MDKRIEIGGQHNKYMERVGKNCGGFFKFWLFSEIKLQILQSSRIFFASPHVRR